MTMMSMNAVDRVGNRLFAFLGVLAWLCATIAVVALLSGGWSTAWPWFRGALLCALPAYSPRIMAGIFNAVAARKRMKRS